MKKYYKYNKGYYKWKKTKNELAVLLVLLMVGAYYGIEKTRTGFYIGLLVCVVALVLNVLLKFYRKYRRRKKYLNSKIRDIDAMNGIEFERFLAEHFRKQGYKVTDTPTSNDYGADLVIAKNGVKTVVQAKRYKGKVSNSAVQEIVGAIAYYKADKAMVVTNAYFTANAKALAEANSVELWDREKLIDVFQIK